jgi:hypothetical protein
LSSLEVRYPSVEVRERGVVQRAVRRLDSQVADPRSPRSSAEPHNRTRQGFAQPLGDVVGKYREVGDVERLERVGRDPGYGWPVPG